MSSTEDWQHTDLGTDGKKPSNLPLLFHFWRGGGNSHPFFLEGKNEGNVPAKGSLTCQKPLPRNYCNFWLARAVRAPDTLKLKGQEHAVA